MFEERGIEAEQLLTWLREQPRTPKLLTAAVLRWVDSFTADKLRGMAVLSINAAVQAAPPTDTSDDAVQRH